MSIEDRVMAPLEVGTALGHEGGFSGPGDVLISIWILVTRGGVHFENPSSYTFMICTFSHMYTLSF